LKQRIHAVIYALILKEVSEVVKVSISTINRPGNQGSASSERFGVSKYCLSHPNPIHIGPLWTLQRGRQNNVCIEQFSPILIITGASLVAINFEINSLIR
jgi:hypothetical protein